MGQAFDFRYLTSAEPNPMVMAEQIMQFAPASDSEALKLLRRRFPDCPLSARVAALDFLMRRKSRPHPRP